MPNAPCPEVSRLRVSRLPCGLVLGYPCDAASAAAYGRLPEWPKGAVCKTVGSAYVGSNPTPATTCVNGPLAAETRPAGRFVLVTPCIRVCHVGSVCCGVHGRIADGVRAARTVGAHRRLFHGRPRTGSAGCRGRRRPVCQEGCGGFAFRSFAGVAPGGSKDFGKFAGLARLAPCGPSGRAAGSVAERHANCRSAGRAGPLWRAPRRVARTDGHAGSARLRGCLGV